PAAFEVHPGAHVAVPQPATGNARTLPSAVPTYIFVVSTAGACALVDPVCAVHCSAPVVASTTAMSPFASGTPTRVDDNATGMPPFAARPVDHCGAQNDSNPLDGQLSSANASNDGPCATYTRSPRIIGALVGGIDPPLVKSTKPSLAPYCTNA